MPFDFASTDGDRRHSKQSGGGSHITTPMKASRKINLILTHSHVEIVRLNNQGRLDRILQNFHSYGTKVQEPEKRKHFAFPVLLVLNPIMED